MRREIGGIIDEAAQVNDAPAAGGLESLDEVPGHGLLAGRKVPAPTHRVEQVKRGLQIDRELWKGTGIQEVAFQNLQPLARLGKLGDREAPAVAHEDRDTMPVLKKGRNEP